MSGTLRGAAAASHETLPIAPSLDLAVPRRQTLVTPRVLFISAAAVAVGVVAGLTAQLLTALIGLVTNRTRGAPAPRTSSLSRDD